jgi:hypothetical protein
MKDLFESYHQATLFRLVYPPVLSEVEVIRTKNPLWPAAAKPKAKTGVLRVFAVQPFF